MQVSLRRVLGNPNHVRLLRLLDDSEPLRFNEIQDRLDLGPSEVTRALDVLKQDLWILPETIPTNGDRVFLEWRLSKRGRALVDAWDTFHQTIRARRRSLGDDVVREFEAVYA